jgi:hypothetical protein
MTTLLTPITALAYVSQKTIDDCSLCLDIANVPAHPDWGNEQVFDARIKNTIKGRLAELSALRYTDEWMATNQLYNIADVAENGLPFCYSTPQDWMWDFWMDFSWNTKKQINEVNLVLNDPRFPAVNAMLIEKIGFDMKEELLRVGVE